MSRLDGASIAAMYEADAANAKKAYVSPCAELMKLWHMLDDAGIDWRDLSELGGEFPMHRIRGHGWSVIYGRGSYGAQQGLLEFMATDRPESVEGWLTAEQAFEMIQERM